MTNALIVATTVALLTLGRVWYLRTHPVQKDVQEAILPLSKRLHAGDFFRRPQTEEVRFAFWIVQYGTLWYAINLPLMHLAGFDGRRWTYLMSAIDIFFVWISFELGLLGAFLYIAINTFNLFKAPWNVSIVWLIVCAVFSWIFLLLAPLAKLPIGIPTRVWTHVRQALVYKKNPYYYGLLGVIWLFVAWRTLLPGLFGDTWLGSLASLEVLKRLTDLFHAAT